jgi:ketosteroid isomerase-like protein
LVSENVFDILFLVVVSYVGEFILVIEKITELKRSLMTPKEIVMSGYQFFSDGDMENLAKIFHENALIKVNGSHELSGEYRGFEDLLLNFFAQIPVRFPNFNLEILNVTTEDERVQVRVHLTADNLDSEAMHCFVVKNGLQTEFDIFDDSQKIATALNT